MENKRIFLTVVIVVALVAVIAAVAVSVAGARVPSYAVKGRVLDKSETNKWIEVRVLEQAKGKTKILGDQVIVRVLSGTTTFNKDNTARAQKSWLTKVVADPTTGDLVSVLGEYKSSDGTIWADKIVNRSR